MRGYLRTFALFGVFTLFMIGVGWFVGMYTGRDPNVSMITFLTLSLLFSFIMYFASAKMVLWQTGAKLVTPQEAPRLHAIVDRVALRAGIPKPKVAIMQTWTPNAFATGRNPKNAVVAATHGILNLLDDEELEGVIAHEISHVKNRDILIMTIASALASAVSYLGYMLLFGGRDRNVNPLFGLLFFILAPIGAMIIQLAISRSREFGADASGAHLLGRGDTLARALRKIEQGVHARPLEQGNPATSSLYIINPFRGVSMSNMFRTHPRTEDRVRRLQELNLGYRVE